ncbi:hypothetical protein GGI25_000593 [Coemansia spiralis]|uniref:Uncharacterized protein n=2 Tax=Coemansia TaxID=4863 RepID=A0A9W8GCJ1_9FUNG|nr:hypothetical protein BX070DRAFT_228464 [Coemansia spiralis]KAJ1996054.1 hypothetical protein EDC05_000422 [Coemansia umbellata]KAJ2625495.1 hypothetical protein GGI26_000635 [Coemansia sp. RSA 1358]KAJ2680620.1 hypothetical protein GGI25_000593 [Coemansia spiralis]
MAVKNIAALLAMLAAAASPAMALPQGDIMSMFNDENVNFATVDINQIFSDANAALSSGLPALTSMLNNPAVMSSLNAAFSDLATMSIPSDLIGDFSLPTDFAGLTGGSGSNSASVAASGSSGHQSSPSSGSEPSNGPSSGSSSGPRPSSSSEEKSSGAISNFKPVAASIAAVGAIAMAALF